MIIRVCQVSWVSFMYRYAVVMCMLVIVALPILMGTWSTAFLLGQHVEYYYYLLPFRYCFVMRLAFPASGCLAANNTLTKK